MSKHNNVSFLPDSVQRFLFVLIKLSIVFGAGFFIYQKLINNDTLDIELFSNIIYTNNIVTVTNIVILILFSCFNWFLESLKWKQLVNEFTPLSVGKSIEQTLGSLTASIITPNRIGEYGAKAIYYKKGIRKKILGLNLIGNLAQLSITLVLGIIGIIGFISIFNPPIAYFSAFQALVILVSIATLFFFYNRKRPITFRGYSLSRLKQFYQKITSKTIVLTIVLSLTRYLVFSTQFYFLLTIFNIDVSYTDAMLLITTMYLLVSIIPTIFIFDVIVKGSVAVWLFSFVNANELIMLTITTLMWVFNFAIPSVFGSYYVLNFKTPTNPDTI